MAYDTAFYIFGGALALIAVITSFIGLRSERFPGRAAPLVILAFVALIGVTTTYSVLNGQQEAEHREHELEHANAEVEHLEEEPVEEAGEDANVGEEDESPEPAAGGEAHSEGGAEASPEGGAEKPKAKAEGGTAKAPAGGPGGTLQLAASETEIAYDTTELTSKPGKVTIDFTNPAVLEHDVAIERDGEEIAKSETISKGETSVSAELAAGEYTFFCTVPGHAEAGMQGTLTVK
jgi:plastocyanin